MGDIVKNEATAAERVAAPIPFYDDDGQLAVGLTFGHATAASGDPSGAAKEVETFTITNGWVEAAANAVELDGSGIFRYQYSQAETDDDTIIGVRLSKTGYRTQYYWNRIVPAEAVVSSGSPLVSHLLSPFMIEIGTDTPIYFKVFDVNGNPATLQAANMSGKLTDGGGAAYTATGTFAESDAGDHPGVYTYTPGGGETAGYTAGGVVLQVHNTDGEPSWDDFSVGYQAVFVGVGLEDDVPVADRIDAVAAATVAELAEYNHDPEDPDVNLGGLWKRQEAWGGGERTVETEGSNQRVKYKDRGDNIVSEGVYNPATGARAESDVDGDLP